LRERLKIITELIQQRNELASSLKFHSEILQIQQEIDSSSTKGVREDCHAQINVAELQKVSLETKKPIISHVDSTVFDYDVLLPLFEKIVKLLSEQNNSTPGLKKFLDPLKNNSMKLSTIVRAVMDEDATSIGTLAKELDVSPALLLHATSALLQPCLEEIARRIDTSFSNNWWQTSCPVCGRTPIVARVRNRRRHLLCTFCGAEYLSDRFVCVHCGNKDPYTLKFMAPERQPGFQIDFCTSCKQYIKVIDEEKLRETIPKGLEDILTLNLDLAAKEAGLRRD